MSDTIALELPRLPTIIIGGLFAVSLIYLGLAELRVHHFRRLRDENVAISREEMIRNLHGDVDLRQRSYASREKGETRGRDARAAWRLLKDIVP
jgi:hypothetical protein